MAKFFEGTLNNPGNIPGGTGTYFLSSQPYVPTSTLANPQNRTTSAGAGAVPAPTSGFSSPINPFQGQTRFGSGVPGSFKPGPGTRTGTRISVFGRKDFDAALVDWNRVYQDAQQGIPAALELIEQFAPGGGFGTGRRREARELIGQGVARDTAASVASGLSSTSAARGLNVLAGRELATQFGNIEDMRAQLQIAAFSPYTQMLSNLAQVGTARPTAGQFIERIATPTFGTARGTTTKFLS